MESAEKPKLKIGSHRETIQIENLEEVKHEDGHPIDQLQQDIKQFQSTYQTLQLSSPDLFASDKVAKYIKVEGFVEKFSENIEALAQLHQDLDYIEKDQNQSPVKAQDQNKINHLIEQNKGVWDKWWNKKLQSNVDYLSYVKEQNYEEVVKCLDHTFNGDKMCSVNYQEPETGMSGLHYAVKFGNMKLANLLISNNIDVMMNDANGQTALHLACLNGDLEAYQIIVNRNYNSKNCFDNKRKTPLDYAVLHKHHHIINYDKQLTVTIFSSGAGNMKSPGGQKLKPADFEILQKLGSGAFGSVYLVQKDSNPYAMKVMKKRKYNGILNLVLTEKEVQRKIKSRFVVQLKYAFQTFDKLYLVSEYCHGGDLRGLIKQKKKLNEEDARLYLAEILVALEELHINGIVHRDIKLDNILLDQNGHVKLTDFGLSKEGMFESKLTDTMLGGGRSYLIPEVLKERHYDKSVDIYLYGLLAFELLAGFPAYPADMPDLEKKVLKAEYEMPYDFSTETRDFISKLIVVDPHKRISIRSIKKLQFFKKIDWKIVSEGKLKMPKIKITPVVKAEQVQLSDSEDEDFRMEDSFEGDRNSDNIQEEFKFVEGEELIYDNKSGQFVANPEGRFENSLKVNDELMNSNARIINDVPDFYYSQDIQHQQI